MRKCSTFLLLMVGIAVIGITIYLFSAGFIGFDHISPKFEMQDDYEIVYSAIRTNEFYFIKSDGTITAPYKPFINDPNAGWWQGVGVMKLITWSPDGDLLATRSTPSGGIPVLLTNEGEFIKCGGQDVPIADERVWVFENFTVISPDQRRYPNVVVLYDMKHCEMLSVIYEAANEDVVIEEATISRQGWLAINGYDLYDVWIKIIAPDGTEYEIYSAFHPGWSRDGEQLVFTVLDEGVFIADKYGGNIEQITDNMNYALDTYPSWSPDGRWIIYSVDGAIYKYDIFTNSGEIIAVDGHHPNWRWTNEDTN